jgi:molybdopterin converting factor small subunit
VIVRCYGPLREHLPDPDSGTVELDLPEGARVADALAALGIEGRAVHALLLDGRRAAPVKELGDGAELTLMPPFTGGAAQDL